jgi:methylated-DNA-[protein]-cysteine S-methyltransferase
MTMLCEKTLDTEIGALRLVADDDALVAVDLPTYRHGGAHEARRVARHDVLDHAARELGEYFAGRRRTFTTPLRPDGTEFQREVWDALLGIPFGETCSYGAIAKKLGRPRAVRAVGAANGRNPLPIIVPCHRVIGASGALVGYGGGLDVKRWLLRHEGVA